MATESQSHPRHEQSEPTGKWFERLRDGDRAASAELYARLFPRMRACAILLMGERGRKHPTEVDEVVHDVFVDVLLREASGRLETVTGADDLRRYLATAIHHLIVTRARQRTRRREVPLPSDSAHGLVRPTRGPVTSLLHQDSLSAANRRVEAALVRLPEHHRQAITLRYVSGLTSAEIQVVMSGPAGTPAKYFASQQQVRTTLCHAMRRLRDLLPNSAGEVDDYFDSLDR
jgi:RNA polymerase sigma factor (sigma-70 family)